MEKQRNKKGIAAVEMLVGISIAAVVLIAASFSIVTFVNTSHNISIQTQALYLAEEGIELVRYVRDNDWTDISSLTTGATYYIETTVSTIDIGSTPETVGYFTRSVSFENAYRDNTSDDIVASGSPGSYEDTDTKIVTVTVGGGGLSSDVALISILTNINP
jgi:type II secretory pathway pseudopilin PulG